MDSDGKIVSLGQHKYRSLRDALRAFSYEQTGVIAREDIYFLAILRRQLAERELPLQDGPISVVSFGKVVPEPLFHTSKKLFPVSGPHFFAWYDALGLFSFGARVWITDWLRDSCERSRSRSGGSGVSSSLQ